MNITFSNQNNFSKIFLKSALHIKMVSNALNLSGEDYNASNPKVKNPSRYHDKSKDIERNDNLPDDEKAEDEIWQGIKSEKAGNFKLAASYYRSAIKHNPECAKAYRLLSYVLKRIRETENGKRITVKSQQLEKISSAKDLNISAAKLDNSFTEKRETVANSFVSTIDKNLLQLNKGESNSLNSPNLFDLNLIPLKANLNVNNTDLSSQQKSEMVSLPSMEISPSGDMVLQDNLAVSKLYIEQALAFFEQKQWDKSIAACKEALKICPSMGKAYKVWGNCLQQSGNSADAIGIYAKALELQPNMPQVYCNLGSIYAKSKKWQQAIEYYQKSILIDPDCAAPYRNLARVWDELGECGKSEECFFKAVAIKPELITAKNHFDLAHNLAEENKLDRAIACYKNCIKLEPSYLNAYVRLAQLLEKAGQTDEALYYYKKLARLQTGIEEDRTQSKSRQQIHKFLFGKKRNKTSTESSPKAPLALKANNAQKVSPQLAPGKPANKQEQIAQHRQKAQQQPNSALAQFELGNLYFLAGKWQNAITYYLKAIKLAPRQTRYYLNLGKAWEKSGDAIKANQSFYQAFSLEPDKVTGQKHLLLGNKLLEQQQIKPAIACYRRAITQNPKLVESYWQLGRILLSGENEQGAIACYQQALKVDPQNPRSYFFLGNAFTQTNQAKAAISCYQKAAEIDPDNADIWHNLGEASYQAEKWQDAVTAYQKAIALNPNNSWSYNNLGDALLKVQQWQGAVDSLRRAIELKPDFVWSHYNLGEALSELEQWNEALTAYKLAQQLDPNLPRVKEKIGGILHRRSKNSRQEAASFCEAQIKEDPDNIELYHQAISLNRKNHKLYLGLGKALAKQGKFDEAVSIFQIGLEIKPEDLELLSELNQVIQVI